MAKWKKGDPSPNPAGRPKGRTDAVLNAIKSEFGGEPQFWQHIAVAAKGGDANCLNLLANRVRATLKSRSATVKLDIDSDNLTDFSLQIIKSTSNGELSPEEASQLLVAIASGQKIAKLDELEQKVDQLLEARHA